MRIVIEISKDTYEMIMKHPDIFRNAVSVAVRNGTPLPENRGRLIDDIIDDIKRYELDCRFADISQTDECTICNKNVFGSVYRIIEKHREEKTDENNNT